jgi:Bax protein
MKFIRYIILIFCFTTLLTSQVSAQGVVRNYISKYKELATALSDQYGIPVAVILGVAIVESSAGKGPAVRNLNNHFGIEGHNTLIAQGKHKSRYKEYECDSQSYEDFCKLITRKHFYERIKTKKDPVLWVNAMSKAHYSEIPEAWKKKIITAIHAYHLESLD